LGCGADVGTTLTSAFVTVWAPAPPHMAANNVARANAQPRAVTFNVSDDVCTIFLPELN
jgi:hypothetical protein